MKRTTRINVKIEDSSPTYERVAHSEVAAALGARVVGAAFPRFRTNPMRIKLDQHWTERLLTWPESGMGYQRVDVTMADGRQLRSAVVVNAEWLEVPAEFSHATVADIRMRYGSR